MSDNVYWVLELTINDGQQEAFKALAAEMSEATQANEPGALNYEWTIGEDGKTVHIYERYADSAATMVHLAAFGANFAERFLTVFTPTRFVVYGNASDEVKEALSGFGPAYLTPTAGFAR